MIKKQFIIFFLIICNTYLIAQVNIKAEMEILYEVEIGTSENQIIFSANIEEAERIVGIAVTNDGYLFLPSNYGSKPLETYNYVYMDNIFKRLNINGVNIGSFCCVCQDGYICYNDSFYSIDLSKGYSILNLENYLDKKYLPNGHDVIAYNVPEGIVIYSFRDSKNPTIAVEIKENEYVRTITDLVQIQEWLTKQAGCFSIDLESAFLKKNNFRYSIEKHYFEGFFVGKLKSGHNVIEYNGVNIIDSYGNLLLQLDYPWLNDDDQRVYSFGIGSYGEMYFLIYPELVREDDKSYAKFGDKAELVVVRNHLKYFGVLTDDRIRLRSEPTTSSESLGTYPINTGFMILEKGTKQETIGGDTGVWYKVRLLDGKEGWFFGAYVRDLYDGPETPLPWPNVADWN